MAQKRPEGQKRKETPRKEAREETVKVVLVGTYKGDQLTRWRGWYNYPISEGDFNVGTPKGGENKQTDLLTPNGVRGAGGSQLVATGKTDAMNCVPPDFSHINELWLFNGTKDQKTFKAEFVGIKTRKELIRDYGYPAKGKAHGERYLLFKTEFMYQHKLTPPKEAERVVVRTADFARSPKVRSQLKAYLESPDRNNPDLAKRLPSIITRLRPEQLRVCEAAVQLDFLDTLGYAINTALGENRAKISGKFTCLDFFAGSGLVSMAMAKQFETVWANDISEKKALVFKANVKNNVLNVRPIETVSGHDLPAVDLSWGSFPCQDLSLAGDMNGLYASRSGLFWQWLRVMDEMAERPSVVVAENVVGLVSADDGKYYVVAHEELARRGYNVGAVMLDAIHWVPQSRKRIFIIAVKKGVNISEFVGNGPEWCHPEPIVNVSKKVNEWVWWHLPKPPPRSISISDIIEFNAPCDGTMEQRAKLRLVPTEKLKLIRAQSATTRKVYTGYRRTRNHRQVLEVRTDGIAGCLRTPCGGSSRQIVLIAENGNIKTRLLTVREAARLMGAPDSFQLPGSYNDGYMAMGDGVAFPVAEYLSKYLLAPVSRLAQ